MSEACFKAIEPLLGTKAACAAVGRDLPPIRSMTFVSTRLGLVVADVCKKSSTSEPVLSVLCHGRVERAADARIPWTTVLQTSAPVVVLTSFGR